MRLTLEEVEHVAGLAQLALAEEEKELFCEQLSSILEYAGRLQQLDTGDIPPTASVLPLENIMRGDEVRPSLSRSAAIRNAPARDGAYFQVPIVLEDTG
jgi:aspartyl-tRNA(Asn)/glutamyl-tRNA(Gln) amidotransferase subunit C